MRALSFRRAEPGAGLQLGFRLVHILRRLMPAALYLLQRDGQFLTGHDLFLKRVGASFHAFIEVPVLVLFGHSA